MKKILLSALCVSIFFFAKAQTSIPAPNGEAIVGASIYMPAIGDPDKVVVATAKGICVYDVNTSGLPVPPPISCFAVNGDVKIVSVKPDYISFNGNLPVPFAVLIGLSDGSVWEVGDNNPLVFHAPFFSDANQAKDVGGDAIYELTNNNCYVTRDTGQTWQIDTLGFGGVLMMYRLDVDSNQRVYLGTSTGLFQQELISNQWNKNNNYTGSAAIMVSVDWMQRIWVASYSALYVSSNFGTSFNPAPAGITGTIKSVATDHWGNAFVITDNKVYRSAGGTLPFAQVDAGIVSQINEPPGNYTFNSVSADSVVCVGSSYGVFSSNDQGVTWHLLSVPAEANAGLAKTAAGRLVVSNNNGVHTRNAGSNTWIKTFPASGVGIAEKIFKTSNGHLYTTTQGNKLIWKSIDDGDTWTIDTAGYPAATTVNTFYIDPNENMHAELVTSTPLLYVRNSGGTWMPDTGGYIPGTVITSYGTDNNGYLYACNYSGLQKRLIAGGTWSMDSVGLSSTVYDLAMDATGILWAGCYTGLFKRTAGVWHQLSNPPGTSTSLTNSCFVVNVDGANALWTQWSVFDIYFNAIGTGVYFTLDSGSHWTSMQFDTITLKQLISVGDTTYGISYFNGLWQFTRNGVSINIQEEENGNSLLTLFPNPARNELTISVKEKFSTAKISISDVNGRKLMETNFINTKQKTLDISKLARGLYVFEISGEGIHAMKKFVKQ